MPRNVARQLEVGARGWQHPAWQDAFYPDGLPEDWRLAYYANEFRCVLLPPDYWRDESALIFQELAELPEGIKLFFELNGDVNELTLFAAWRRKYLVSTPVAGAIVQLAGSQPSAELQDTIQALAREAPVHLYVPGTDMAVCKDLLTLSDDIRLVWKKQWQSMASEDGMLSNCKVGVLTNEETANLRELRGTIEAFVDQNTVDNEVFLFFTGTSPNVEAMRQSLIIYSLLA